jgi:hypothetical protein
VGNFTHADAAGHNRFHFTGRVRGHKLAVGPYKLVATPSAHGTTGQARSAKFRILA